ncbi:MAG: ABC transporter ATP-binding protein [Clostridium sp.]|jgi:energy-coupling factor transport system ATP-binding protein|nr:ABC transporter ATP-binding protein [Clostridium sp.]
MNKPLIEFQDFCFQYHAQSEPTLRGISLKIHAGEKILILGASGSGKSTLGSCLNGLVPASFPGACSGRLTVDGLVPGEAGIFEVSRSVGTVLQDPDGQFVGLTVGEDIAFALENEGVERAAMIDRVSEAARLVGIARELDAPPHALSGGQKQRVSLAGVLVSRVKLLLFDEPLANLDPATGKQAIGLIDRIQKETGAAILIIEHRLEDALAAPVDRILLMDSGKIVADLPPNELLATDLLRRYGIREPLYLTASRYAGAEIRAARKPDSVDGFLLEEKDKAALRSRFGSAAPAKQPEEEPLLRVENLSFSYERGHATLNDVSFGVPKGQMAAVAGTNGAGKSTLSKLICGFLKPSAGTISLRGRDLADRSITERARHIGFVMQNPNQMISKPMIFDEVALVLRNANIGEAQVKERVEETLHVCGLFPFRNWPVSALSFGQRKRVTIASILVQSPEILILDEPTAGQDLRHYTAIMEFLEGLNRTGLTVILITHDMHLVLEYASRVLVFSEGILLADEKPSKILTDRNLVERASLKETSLFTLAKRCGIREPASFVQNFIDCDKAERKRQKGTD